jgi:hypothetical protein
MPAMKALALWPSMAEIIRKRNLLMEYVDALRAVIQKVNAVHPFHIDAMVILLVTYMPYGHYPWMIAITRHSGC